MPADYRETAYAVPSVRPTVFSLELVLKVKITAMDRCAFDELVDSSSDPVPPDIQAGHGAVEVST
jgi:hypothetical protein